MPYGITVKHDQDSKRIELRCQHQNGVIYIVPSEASWVCPTEHLHAHALAGFFGELLQLPIPQLKDLLQRWGLYFRERPLEENQES